MTLADPHADRRAEPIVTALADAMLDRLAASGALTDDRWHRAMHAAPRHLFAPPRIRVEPDGREPYVVDRAADPARWLEAAYADAPIATQVDDGAGDPAEGGWATSSLSAPGAVAVFLELLDLRDHDRVLEIGTGTGWTAALLSARLGDGAVVSVEVDEQVAEQAAANLATAGFAPALIIGNGEAGWPDGAPYDRMHIACGVTTVPYAWVEQTRPGGVIAFPWMPEYLDGHAARLTVTCDGRAIGRLHASMSYMMLRSQRSRGFPPMEGGDESGTLLDPRAVTGDSYGADIAIAAMLPDVAAAERTTPAGHYVLELADTDATSWARIEHRPGHREHLVTHAGRRRLWDEVTDAYLRWVGWGSPGRNRFGLTVGPDGQHVWRDDPSNVITPRP